MRLLLTLILLSASCLKAQDPVDFAGWLKRGIEEFTAAEYSNAVAAFEQAVALNSASVTAHLYLATAHMQLYIPGVESPGNVLEADAAVRELLRALEIEPKNGLALASLAGLALNQKRWDEAQKWFETLTAAEPNNADAYYSMGFIAWSKWYPAYGRARQGLGMKQEDAGPMPDGAIKEDLKAEFTPVLESGLRHLQRALEINPDYADAMAYTNLLVREAADLRDSKAEYDRDIAVANDWVDKALAAKKRLAEPRNASAQSGGSGGGDRARSQAPAPPPPTPDMQVSEAVAEQFVVRQASPIYPSLAKEARIQGTVRLAVIIDWRGTVVYVRVISGHPLLIPSALDAVKQWEYSPRMFNAGARYAATQVSVNYTLTP